MFTYWMGKNKDLIRMNSRDAFRTLLNIYDGAFL